MKFRRQAALFLALTVGGAAGNHWTNSRRALLATRGGATDATDASATPAEVAAEDAPLPEAELRSKSLRDLLGTKLLSSEGEVEAAAALEGKTVALYFCSKQVTDMLAAAEGEVTMPTPLIKSVYDKARAAGKKLEVVYVPVADDDAAFADQFGEMPWLAVKPSNTTIANLVRKVGLTTLPSVVIVDEAGEVVTTDGYSNMVYFPNDFPWRNKNVRQLLGDKLVKADGSSVDTAPALDGKVIGLYFSASWCQPCKTFTPVLKELYTTLKAAGKNFEVIFVSSDKSEEEFKGYLEEMPWLAMPYEGDGRGILASVLGLRALPTLLLYDEENRLITPSGRAEVMRDPTGANFPWHPKPVSTLEEGINALAQRPAVLVFMEGASAADQEKAAAALLPVAEERAPAQSSAANPAAPPSPMTADGARAIAFLTATEVSQLSGVMRKLCGMEEIQGKFKYMKSKKDLLRPRLVLLDLVEGKAFVDEESPVTAEAARSLLSKFDGGTLEMKPLVVTAPDDSAAGGAADGEDGLGQ